MYERRATNMKSCASGRVRRRWRTGTCRGEWSEDKAEYGTKTFAHGDYYENFVRDKRDGHGTYVWANGDSYEGNWDDGEQSGVGPILMPMAIYMMATGRIAKGGERPFASAHRLHKTDAKTDNTIKARTPVPILSCRLVRAIHSKVPPFACSRNWLTAILRMPNAWTASLQLLTW